MAKISMATRNQSRPNIDLDQMPILKCLFEEISQLKTLIQGGGNNQLVSASSHKKPSLKNPSNINNQPQKLKKFPTGKSVLKPSSRKELTKSQLEKKQNLREFIERLSQPKTERAPRRVRTAPSVVQEESGEMINISSRTNQSRSRTSSPGEGLNVSATGGQQRPVPKPRQHSPKTTRPPSAKQPPTYRTTNTHRLRVLTSRAKRAESEAEAGATPTRQSTSASLNATKNSTKRSSAQEIVNPGELSSSADLKELLKKLYETNLESTGKSTGSLSSAGITTNNLSVHGIEHDSSPMHTSALSRRKPMTPPTTLPIGNFNPNGTNQSTGKNDSLLLNRVDLESTIDTMNYQNLQGLLNLPVTTTSTTNAAATSPTKTVQFGNTYVYKREYSSDERHSQSSRSARSSSPTTSTSSSSSSASAKKYVACNLIF